MTAISHRVTVYIDPKWVTRFREQKFNLCTAFGVQSSHSKERYNIIASSEEPTPLNTISWIDTYEIAGCKTGFQDGAYVFPNTVPVPIQPGQTFTLHRNWTNITQNAPNTASAPPSNTITYVSEESSSALLFKLIRNRQRPIYLSSLDNEVAPPGKHTLQPQGTILIFFAQNGEDQTAFDTNAVSTASFELTYTADAEMASNVSYNDLGVFSLFDAEASSHPADGSIETLLPERLVKHLEDESAE